MTSRHGKGAGDRASTPLKGLSNVQMRAGMAAVALVACMLLPWYQENRAGGEDGNRIAISVLSWVEAAVLLVAAAVLYLLYARSQRRGFHLPGGDGWAVTIAGAWTLFLLVWRLFDRPDVGEGISVGVQWGLFVTMGVAVALALAGQAMRAERRPEPPNPAADDPTWEMPTRRQRLRRPVDPEALTHALDTPQWEGEPPPPPRRARRSEPKPPPPPPPEGKLF